MKVPTHLNIFQNSAIAVSHFKATQRVGKCQLIIAVSGPLGTTQAVANMLAGSGDVQRQQQGLL